MVGADVTDQSGNEHLGVIEFPVPILWGSPEIIKQIRMVLLRETTAEWSINRVNGQGPTEPCPFALFERDYYKIAPLPHTWDCVMARTF